MIDDFLQLGATTENIEQRVGQFGNGLFTIKPTLPIAIEIPESLWLDAHQLILDGVDLIMDTASGIPADAPETERRRKQSHLRLGIERALRLPRTLLRKALPDLPAPAAGLMLK